MQDPIVMKKYDDNILEGLKVSCHTKFRFAEHEAQCILGECGPLNNKSSLLLMEQIQQPRWCNSKNWEFTQQDGWNTRDGRMTKKCHERLGMHSLAPHFFVILPSGVYQPSCCVSSQMLCSVTCLMVRRSIGVLTTS